jgi:hypothetical protein
MKMKLFIKDRSGFRSWRKTVQDFEDEVNAWLAANAGIKVVDVKQSSNGGSFDTTKVVISVWYESDAGTDAANRAALAASGGVQAIQSGRPQAGASFLRPGQPDPH